MREEGAASFRILSVFGIPIRVHFTFALVVVAVAFYAAALGQSVVSSPDVPDRLGQSINVESGLNDGLVLRCAFVSIV